MRMIKWNHLFENRNETSWVCKESQLCPVFMMEWGVWTQFNTKSLVLRRSDWDWILGKLSDLSWKIPFCHNGAILPGILALESSVSHVCWPEWPSGLEWSSDNCEEMRGGGEEVGGEEGEDEWGGEEEVGGGDREGWRVALVFFADTVVDTNLVGAGPGEAGPALHGALVREEPARPVHSRHPHHCLHGFPAECLVRVDPLNMGHPQPLLFTVD